jgi:hypothetical protein
MDDTLVAAFGALAAMNELGQELRFDAGEEQTTESIAHIRSALRLEDSLLEFVGHLLKDEEAELSTVPAGTD